MIKTRYKVGDTISIHLGNRLLVSGTIYINSSIPMNRFYMRAYGVQMLDQHAYQDSDNYEDALVIIDDLNPGKLVVLTLEPGDIKLFTWNDVFYDTHKSLSYTKISDYNSLEFENGDALLIEMTHGFK